jgi:5-methylcytosine-specific restriction endonuclease McrA
MNAALIRLVWQRAGHCCEYCWMPQKFDPTPFEIDHIISEKHKGPTAARNVFLICLYCNPFKDSDISSVDAATRKADAVVQPASA